MNFITRFCQSDVFAFDVSTNEMWIPPSRYMSSASFFRCQRMSGLSYTHTPALLLCLQTESFQPCMIPVAGQDKLVQFEETDIVSDPTAVVTTIPANTLDSDSTYKFTLNMA